MGCLGITRMRSLGRSGTRWSADRASTDYRLGLREDPWRCRIWKDARP